MTLKKLSALSLVVVAVLFVFPYSAAAQKNASNSATKSRTATSSAKNELKTLREETRTATKATITRAKLQEQATMKRLRTEYKTKIAQIKDEKKQALVERIDQKLTGVNDRRTNAMLNALDRMQKILAKVTVKANIAKQNGANTSALEAAIASAEAKIASATTLVNDQAEKDYVITVASESALRASVGTTMKNLQNDLRTVHQAVIEAKQSVMSTVRELAKVMRFVKGGTEASESAATE